MTYDIVADIQKLKKEKNAVILAHYYQEGEIQDVADYVGDSYFLAKKGSECQQEVILLAGVVFMAESVKILNPKKKVLVPDMSAGCSLVQSSPIAEYRKWREEFPEAIMVTYINSSAEVKAISDVIVTSSNAQKIIEAIPREREILFGPDQHLGRFLSKKMQRPFHLWPGSCEVHVLFSEKRLHLLTLEHPEAVVIAHPECEERVLKYASVIGSTSRLLEEVEKNPAKTFIVATETGIFHQMQKLRPGVKLIQAPVEDKSCACNDCPYMKLNSLEKVKRSLQSLQPEIFLKTNLRLRAQSSLDRMMDITEGKLVVWPRKYDSILTSTST